MNRKVIAWGDMCLYRHDHYSQKNKYKYTCNAPTAEVEEYMLAHLSRDVIMADWQYSASEIPVETAAVFQKAGFNCLLCPADVGKSQMNAVLSTIKAQNLDGILHTTWHTLESGMPYVTIAAVGSFEDVENRNFEDVQTVTASLMRKVMPSNGDYERSGWNKKQIHCRW